MARTRAKTKVSATVVEVPIAPAAEDAASNVVGKQSFKSWVILELMGHRKLAGYAQEVEICGVPMMRLDVPPGDGQDAVTQFYSPASIYCLTPTTEDVVRRMADSYRPAPVHAYQLAGPRSHSQSGYVDE